MTINDFADILTAGFDERALTTSKLGEPISNVAQLTTTKWHVDRRGRCTDLLR